MILADFSGDTPKVSIVRGGAAFKCAGCGSTETCKSYAGDDLCAGCGHGARSDTCTGRIRETCNKCLGKKVDDLFKGTYCPRCNDWC